MKLRTALLLPVLGSTACIVAPLNYDTVCGRDAEVTMQGFTLAPGQTVEIQTAPSDAGPWTTIATATTSAGGFTIDGMTLHPWSVTTALDQWQETYAWPTGVPQLWSTYVRGRVGGSYSMITFDSSALGAPSGIECVNTEIAGGATVAEAANTCMSPDAPVVRVGADWESSCPCDASNAQHVGDVTIADPFDDDLYHCVETIDGNLTVEAADWQPVQMPALVDVTGTVSLDYVLPSSSAANYQRQIQLDALQSVGGDLDILWDDVPIAGPTLDWGLDAITTVDGTITASVHSVNYTMAGLDGLTSHAGDFAIVGSSGDVSGIAFAPNLTDIGGDLTFEPGYTVTWMFQALSDVGGSVTLDGGAWDPATAGFDVLATVGGDLTLRDMVNNPTLELLPTLTDVGGTLTLDDIEIDDLSDVNSGGLTVGGLNLHANAELTTLDGAWVVVGGDIEITDNPSLETCDAETYVGDQAAAGWGGTSTVSGNLGPTCP